MKFHFSETGGRSPLNPSEQYVHLLSATLKHAIASTRYYSEIFAGRSVELKNLPEFSDFPILTRQTISERIEDLISGECTPDFLRNTSGTTFGSLSRKPLITFHAQDEGALWKRLMLDTRNEKEDLKPLMLRFLSLDHGLDLAGEVKGVFPVPLATSAHFAHVNDLLQRKFSFSGFTTRIRGLLGTLTRLKILTLLCKDQGQTGNDFEIRFIGCHSQVLTERWRRLLQSYWGAEPTEIYGISEIPGLSGLRCDHCSYYHLSPTAYIETVDPDTYKPVTSGIARLIATGLYPLVQMQPFIRYDTEDIVEIMPSCPTTYQPAFEYVGRATDVVRIRDGNEALLLLSPMKLHAVLDDEPDISIEPSPLAISFGIRDIGFHKYRFRHSIVGKTIGLTLDIELRWPPDQYLTHANALRERIMRRLYELSPLLKRTAEDGTSTLSVNLHRPNSISEFTEA